MNTCRLLFRMCLIASACLVVAGSTRAEISADLGAGTSGVNILVMGVIEDSDPIGVTAWQAIRPIPPDQILNSSGYLRTDGRPDVAGDPGTGWPTVVWAYDAGSDHDIAVAEWTGTAWSDASFLTSASTDELDPRVFVESDGTVHVVWWTPGQPDRVFLASRPGGSGIWSQTEEVTTAGMSGRRPSVAAFDGVLRVAYERPSTEPGMAQDVVVVRREPTGGYKPEMVVSTPSAERLDPILHADSGHLWLDWKQTPSEFRWTEHVSALWATPVPTPWADPSWIGVETVRKEIRRLVVE
jgi:hypothetical protein